MASTPFIRTACLSTCSVETSTSTKTADGDLTASVDALGPWTVSGDFDAVGGVSRPSSTVDQSRSCESWDCTELVEFVGIKDTG